MRGAFLVSTLLEFVVKSCFKGKYLLSAFSHLWTFSHVACEIFICYHCGPLCEVLKVFIISNQINNTCSTENTKACFHHLPTPLYSVSLHELCLNRWFSFLFLWWSKKQWSSPTPAFSSSLSIVEITLFIYKIWVYKLKERIIHWQLALMPGTVCRPF